MYQSIVLIFKFAWNRKRGITVCTRSISNQFDWLKIWASAKQFDWLNKQTNANINIEFDKTEDLFDRQPLSNEPFR